MATNKLATTTNLDRIAQALSGVYTAIVAGSGTTPPAESDAALETEVVSKAATESFPVSGSIRITATIPVSEGNGTEFTEVGFEDDNADLATRAVHATIDKTSDFALRYNITQKHMNPET